jgi:hypothetical protein
MNPSFNADILSSLLTIWLVGIATRAIFSGLSDAWAYELGADSAVSIAAPPSPTRNSRRLGSDGAAAFPKSEGILFDVSEDCLRFIFWIPFG